MIGQLAAPPEPHPLAERATRPGPVRAVLVGAWTEMGTDWRRARIAQGKALRAARNLHSAERRFAGDLLTFAVRRRRALEVLLAEAGLREGATPKQRDLAMILAAGALHGAPPPPDGPGVDWAAVADPVHTLEGWRRRTGAEGADLLEVVASLPTHLAAELAARPDGVELAAALDQRAPMNLRVNRTRMSRDAVLARLQGATPTLLAADGVVLPGHVDVNALPPVRDGVLEVQDEGSQLVAELCAPEPGWRVLDLCAGGLGKSLALASLMGDEGEIVASDVRPEVVRKGMKRAKRCGFRSIRPGAPKGTFDLVLVDAPCSGTGALRRRPWGRWSVTAADVAQFRVVQRELLEQALGLLRPGGRLVYATCSLLPSENEAAVDALLEAHPSLRPVPVADLLGAERAERIGAERVLKLEPHRHGTDGFFAAALSLES